MGSPPVSTFPCQRSHFQTILFWQRCFTRVLACYTFIGMFECVVPISYFCLYFYLWHSSLLQFHREALQPAFERHQIAFGDVQVYVRGSKSPLSYQCDTFCLGGQHLRVELVGRLHIAGYV